MKQSFMLVGKSQVHMSAWKIKDEYFFFNITSYTESWNVWLFIFCPKYCSTQILLQYQNTFTYNFGFDFRNDTIVCNKNILELYVFWLILTPSICSSSTVVVLVV